MLRSCNGIDEPNIEEPSDPTNVQRSRSQQVPSPSQPTPSDVGGGLGFFASFHNPPSRDHQLEAVEKEVKELKKEIVKMKDMFKVMADDISSLVKKKQPEATKQTPERKQTRARKQPWWMLSPS